MKTLLFSPHCDDACFSLGSTLIGQKFNKTVVYNVFSQTNYTLNGIKSLATVSKIRQREDQRVMKLLNTEAYYLGFPDACIRPQYRKGEAAYLDPLHQPKNDVLWKKVLSTIRTLIRQQHHCNLLFPLGLGYHIDHRILAEIGRIYLKRQYPVIFYEDVTYEMTTDDTLVKLYVHQLDLYLQSRVFPIRYLQKKINFVKKYVTQVDDEIVAIIRSTARDRGGERVWSKPHILKRL